MFYGFYNRVAVLVVRGTTKRMNVLINSRLLIGRVRMETDRIVAWREPPADFGLSACLRRNADDVHCSHIKIKAQLRTMHITYF